jgi:hypothetical protein
MEEILMLRCTIASLIPLMLSRKYGQYTDEFFKQYKKHFDSIIAHKSFYILPELPSAVSGMLFKSLIPAILKGQRSSGLWKAKDAEKLTYEILSVFKHLNLIDSYVSNHSFKYDVMKELENNYDYYPLLIKSLLLKKLKLKDKSEIERHIKNTLNHQKPDGSWEDALVATVINMEKLLAFGLKKNDKAIKKGIGFLFRNFKTEVKGYKGIIAPNMFSNDSTLEYGLACRLKPEWISRRICFHHLPIIQNSLCLKLLIKSGYEKDARVEAALDNLFALHQRYKGFCRSNIRIR